MFDSHTHSVGELEARAESIGPVAEIDDIDDDERTQLAETLVTLADAYGSRGEFDAEAETIERIRTLAAHDSELMGWAAIALANATVVADRDDVYETGIDTDRIEEYREQLEVLYGQQPEASIAIELARATAQMAHAYGRAETPGRIESMLDRLESLYEAHSTPEVAAQLAVGYAYAERYLDEPAARSRLERVESLFDRHPTDAVASGLAGVIAGRTNADAGRGDIETIESRIGRIEALADRHSGVQIERWLPVATANATRASFDAAEYARLEHWGRRTNELHDALETPESAKWAAAATFYSARGSFFESDVEKGERKLDRLRALEERFDDPVFEQWLARSMFDAARSHAELGRYEDARSIADELERYAVGHEDQAAIESGLESLREQAPGLFGEPEAEAAGSGTTVPIEETDADEPTEQALSPETAGTPPAPGGTPTSLDDTPTSLDDTPTGLDDTPTGLDEKVTALGDSSATDESAAESNPGCGSCGPDGCGSCGSQSVVEPASPRTLVAAGVGIVLVTVSVLYTLYRLVSIGRAAVGGDSE